MPELTYVGNELAVFAHALNWKRYLRTRLKPYLVGDVLEAGAGLGSNTKVLRDAAQRRWVCLEPDPALARQIGPNLRKLKQPCEVVPGSLEDLSPTEKFDAIIYIDVLEHIKDDAGQVQRAIRHLKSHGKIVVLAPAHQWLFTPFDKMVGHYRRYTKSSLRAVMPSELIQERLLYMDSVGLTASLANRFLLNSASPNVPQIKLWDRVLVPLSRLFDPILCNVVGKSVLGIWRRFD
jgi:SAM-dependent methyltransferase